MSRTRQDVLIEGGHIVAEMPPGLYRRPAVHRPARITPSQYPLGAWTRSRLLMAVAALATASVVVAEGRSAEANPHANNIATKVATKKVCGGS